jgi:putative lipoprotein
MSERTLPATLALVVATLALVACGRSEVPTDPPPQPQAPAPKVEEAPPRDLEEAIERDVSVGSFSFEAYAYNCGGQEITVRAGDGELALVLPERSLLLPQVEAASGARYSDGQVSFWGKGIESGILTAEGKDIECELDRQRTPWVDARARGATFRAVGQEPGWNLEIHPDRIVMVYQYGNRRVVVPNVGLIENADSPDPERRWQATTEAHELQVTVEDRGCTDVMSGETFPARVKVKLDGRDYAGCGQDLD